MGLRYDSTVTLLTALVLASIVPGFAQQQGDPMELVRRTVQHEIEANDSGHKFSFRERKETANGSETKLVVETQEATAGMLLAINDHPLSPEQRRGEMDRLDRYTTDPAELKRKKDQEKENVERITKIVKALPDAFLYEFEGTETGNEKVGGAGEPLVRLKFRPNPKFQPPSHVEQVLMGMQGQMLIDTRQNRIAKIDGTLAKEVGFGWGILGHLDPGGHFLVVQADVGGGDWNVTRMELRFTGKVLLFKTLDIRSTKTYSDFHQSPSNMTFAEGVEMLKKQQAVLAENMEKNEGQSR